MERLLNSWSLALACAFASVLTASVCEAQTDRPANVKFLRADSQLSTEAQLKAVGETCGRQRLWISAEKVLDADEVPA